jgi:hypothetical protein
MHCVILPSQRRKVRDFDRQVAELQSRDAVLNGFTAPGNPGNGNRGMSLSRERGPLAVARFVQQSRANQQSDVPTMEGAHEKQCYMQSDSL